MKTISILLLLVTLGFAAAFATPLTPGAPLSWANYHIDTPPGAVYALHQARGGEAWIGSNQGLYTFDGFHAHPVSGTDGHVFAAQIYSIIEEPDGSLWLGTNNGLFKYLASDRLIHRVEGSFPNEIRTMTSDNRGRLWIGSLNGLYVYDPVTGSLRDISPTIPHRAVYALLVSATDGSIYVGTYDGLCRIDPQSGSSEPVNLGAPRGAEGNTFVNALVEDRTDAALYIGTEGALIRYRLLSGETERIDALDGNSVKAIAIYGRSIAAGTDNGLYMLDGPKITGCSRHDSRTTNSIADNVIWTLMTDRDGNLWAGTGAGLSIAEGESAVRRIALAEITGSGEGQTVYSIFRDRKRRLWLGGSNGLISAPEGLTPNASASAVNWYGPNSPTHPLAHNRVRAVGESSDGRLWVAGDGGLNLLDEHSGRFRRMRIFDHEHTHNANWAYAIAEDSAARALWVGCYLGGVFRLDMDRLESSSTGICEADTALTAECGALANNLISNIVRDKEGKLWILLFRDGAVTCVDPEGHHPTGRFDITKATGGWATLIAPDAGGGIWVGYDGGGVVHIDSGGNIGRPVPLGRPHHPSGVLYAMAPVGRELWVATGDGVHAVDTETGKSRLLPLPDNTYSSIYFDRLTNSVLLGTTDAIVQADPRRISARRGAREIRIVRVTVGGKSLNPTAPRIEVPYGAGALSLELATYDYSPNTFERFAYRTSRDSAWTLLPPHRNEIVVSGLSPGRHVLEMRLGDDDTTLRSVTVEMLPPWYLSMGFRIVWACLAVGAGLAIFLVTRRRSIRNLRRLEQKNALEKAEERLNFLTNISHDLKTPLSMIIGPLSRVADGTHSDRETTQAITTAYDNALRLNRLLSHTLDASRLDAATDSAAVTRPTDISALVRRLADNCASAYPACSFRLEESGPEHIIADVDPGKFESIVSNLLSNAIKYSPAGKADITLNLSTDRSAGTFTLGVADKGIGIMPDQLPHIFDRSYRTPRGSDISDGTGIGLYLVKHFAELHGGSVSVESTVGEGSEFRITLPLKASEAVIHPKTRTAPRLTPSPDDKRPRVLIVDDNEDVLTFIASVLEPEYHCACATSGTEGLEMAGTFRPDLIITDEKMPGMTGLEMSRKLKSTPATASISIIMLTAMGSNELESRSISAGIDLYMVKPFDPAMLKARVEALLRHKAEIRRAARIEELTAAKPIEVVSDSERALARITEIVEKQLSSPQLSVAFLCQESGMQSKQLYRLIKKYLDLTPVEYIRKVRLDKAASLLEKGNLTVSEVMYAVGFNSPSYFSKCFSARFGVRPAEYAKKK